jgi:hypothetical protein
MRIALQDLKLDHLTVIYPGDRAYPLADRADVVPFVLAIQDADLIAPPARTAGVNPRAGLIGRRRPASISRRDPCSGRGSPPV